MRADTKKHRRFSAWACTLVSAFALTLALGSPALAADRWTDITDAQWVKTYGITAAQVATVAQGYSTGGFHPTETVTRAQYAKMVLSALGIPPAAAQTPTFVDVSTESFYYPWIEGGVAAGVIDGQPGAVYRPGDPTTRQEASLPLAAYLAQKALEVQGGISGRLGMYPSLDAYYTAEGPSLLAGFADHGGLSADCAGGEAYLVLLGVVRGSGSAGAVSLGPSVSLTRAQAVALILRAKTYLPKPAAPAVKAVAPALGSESGGAPVVITGSGFSRASSVAFGTVRLASGDFSVRSDSEIDIPATPAGASSVDVTVTNPWGTSPTSGCDVFTFVATLGPGDEVVRTALAHLGTPYTWGGAGPSSFDCSGFTQSVYRELGVSLPHHAALQYPLGVSIADPQLQPGDLVFFGSPIDHVGIYVGNGNMIDAPHTGSYVRLESMGWSDYAGACRLLSPDPTAGATATDATHEQSDLLLTYSGPWTTTFTASASGGGFAFANSTGAAVTIRFNGTGLTLITKKSPVYGRARVTVDGADPVIVDLYSPSVLWQQEVWDTGPLAPGAHTVTIEWTGTKCPAATDTNINIDAVRVTG